MGGCRCTYRTCTVKSDGKTHMFHYPVFDKVRCHQWLTNAGRPEFLNLKVSQLRNRVICQHHFKDEHFMNYRKEKLTFEAIPTEDGPYCENIRNNSKQLPKISSIIVDDIENEYLSKSDRKAIVSVKYGDFLMNNDITDLSTLSQCDKSPNSYKNRSINDYPDINIHNINIQDLNYSNVYSATDESNSNIITQCANPKLNLTKRSLNQYIQTATPDTSKKNQAPPILVVTPFCNVEDNKLVEVSSNFDNGLFKQVNNNNTTTTKDMQQQSDKKSKIKIISDQIIVDPLAIPEKCNLIPPKSGKKQINNSLETLKKCNVTDKNKEDKYFEIEEIKEIKPKENILFNERIDLAKNIQETPKKINQKYVQSLNVATSPKVSLLKNKISPERMAAIERKRNFNKKLKDIIESCFDNLDDSDKVTGAVKHMNKQTNILKKRVEQNQEYEVKSQLKKESEISNTNECTITKLHESIKRMEETLLKKIEQNSNMINELKSSVSSKTKSTSTQVAINEEAHKRHLYHEISKYLSPQANNLIYEELFIDKYGRKESMSPPTKRHKAS